MVNLHNFGPPIVEKFTIEPGDERLRNVGFADGFDRARHILVYGGKTMAEKYKREFQELGQLDTRIGTLLRGNRFDLEAPVSERRQSRFEELRDKAVADLTEFVRTDSRLPVVQALFSQQPLVELTSQTDAKFMAEFGGHPINGQAKEEAVLVAPTGESPIVIRASRTATYDGEFITDEGIRNLAAPIAVKSTAIYTIKPDQQVHVKTTIQLPVSVRLK